MKIQRPWIFICIFFFLGIFIKEYSKVPMQYVYVLTIVTLVLSVLTINKKFSVISLFVSFVFLGYIHSHAYQFCPENHISKNSHKYYKQTVWVEGLVVSQKENKKFFNRHKTVFVMQIKRIKLSNGWQERKGKVLVNIFREENINYGDYIVLEGKLHKPFDFKSSDQSPLSYRDYLSRRGIQLIFSVKKKAIVKIIKHNQGVFIKQISFNLKNKLNKVILKNLPEREAGIMQAFLLGDRSNIPKTVYDLFKISGVAHIIAISGFHVGIVTFVLILILKIFPIPRKPRYLLTMMFLVFYAFLTGGQPSVVRAVIMAMVFLISFIIEREQDSINTLSLAAFIILVMNPLNLFDIGFQLSFLSVLFIILFYQKIYGYFLKIFVIKEKNEFKTASKIKNTLLKFKIWLEKSILQSIAISISAYLGVIALLAYYFRVITPIVIIENLIVIPLASLIIFLGIGFVISGCFFPFMTYAFSNCIVVFLNIMIGCVAFFVKMPFAYFKLSDFPLICVFIIYTFVWILNLCFTKKNIMLNNIRVYLGSKKSV